MRIVECWISGVCCCMGTFYTDDFTEALFALLVVDVLGAKGELAPCEGLFINQTVKAHMDNSSACVLSSVGGI